MKLELIWKRDDIVIGVQPVPRLLVWTRYNVRTLSFQRLWCVLTRHAWKPWEHTKYTSGTSRQCVRCGKWESRP